MERGMDGGREYQMPWQKPWKPCSMVGFARHISLALVSRSKWHQLPISFTHPWIHTEMKIIRRPPIRRFLLGPFLQSTVEQSEFSFPTLQLPLMKKVTSFQSGSIVPLFMKMSKKLRRNFTQEPPCKHFTKFTLSLIIDTSLTCSLFRYTHTHTHHCMIYTEHSWGDVVA